MVGGCAWPWHSRIFLCFVLVLVRLFDIRWSNSATNCDHYLSRCIIWWCFSRVLKDKNSVDTTRMLLIEPFQALTRPKKLTLRASINRSVHTGRSIFLLGRHLGQFLKVPINRSFARSDMLGDKLQSLSVFEQTLSP